MTFGQRWSVVLGSSLVLWGISERIFWSLIRPDDLSPLFFVSIIPYTIATYCMFLAMQYFRVSTFPGVLLLGALYGWLVEGVVAMTVFGAAGMVFPFSLSWTGLAWHMLISVALVWWWHRTLMQRSFLKALTFSAGLGVFWGMWNMTWFLETPPVLNDMGQYIVHAFGVTLLMVVGHILMSRHIVTFAPPKMEVGIILAIVALYFGVVTVPVTGGLALVVLPVLAGMLHLALRRSRTAYESSAILMQATQKVPIIHILTLFAAPFVATAMYGVMLENPAIVFPFNIGMLLISTGLGFSVFAWAWWKVFRKG